jgi:adenosylhomocysteine nucleosidase
MPNNLAASEIQPCHLGVIFALGIESGFLEDSLKGLITIRGEGFKAKEGGLHGHRTVIFLSGPGRENAAKAAETLIDGHKPQYILSAGFAGGLSPQLKRHDILLADEVMLESGESIAISPLPTNLRSVPGEGPGVRAGLEKAVPTSPHIPDVNSPHPNPLPKGEGTAITGKLLTADRVIRTAEEKKSLCGKTGAVAVDMETFAVAEVCRRRMVPFLAVRIIHDPAGETLPPDIEKLLNQKTETARLGAAIGALWKRPSSIKDMWALKENSLVAAKKLADFIAKLTAML